MDVFELDAAVTKDNAAVVSHDTLTNALIPSQTTI
jgi:glycerophosphoryl diester phosphodiesterase